MTTICGVGTHSKADRGLDFYPTPKEATVSLLAIESKWMPKGKIWEPACGNGAIVDILRERGHKVVASDVVKRKCKDSYVADFLTAPVKRNGPAVIITNPPFRLARAFIDTALKHTDYVAMLLRLAFLEGGARKPWFETVPLARVHVSSRRLPMMHRDGWTGKKAGSAVCHAWFVFDAAHEGRPDIRWFDYKEHMPANDNVKGRRRTKQIDIEELIAEAA